MTMRTPLMWLFLWLSIPFMQLMAQERVQRSFMGCRFGAKKEQVVDSLSAKGIQFIHAEDAIVIEAKKEFFPYQEVAWSYVCLHFFDNQFYTISFTCDDTEKNRQQIKLDYQRMRKHFEQRHKDNMLYNLEQGLRIHDGFTGVFCHIDCVDTQGEKASVEEGKMRLFLTFVDEKIDQVKRMLEE